MPKNALILITGLETGGAERLVWQLARGLQNEFSITVAALDGRGEYAEIIRAEGIEVIDLRAYHKINFLSALRRLRKILKQRNFSLINTHLYHAGIIGRLAAWGLKIPVISTAHIVERRDLPWRFWIERLTARLCTAEICVSQAVKKFMQTKTNLKDDYYHVIHNGIDLAVFTAPETKAAKYAARKALGFAENDVLIGYLGRFDYQKGVDIFLAALCQPLLRGRRDFVPLLAGYGDETAALRKMAPSNVIFIGKITHPEQFLRALDICIIPSRWEGFGLVALEAQACGAVVIASKVDSLPEIIHDELDGLLTAPEDAPMLAEKISAVLANNSLRDKLIVAGINNAQKFSVNQMCQEYNDLFLSILASTRQE